MVVYPNTPSTFNPFGSYFENIVIHSPVKLQGVGPGGLLADGTHVPGSVLDGLGYGTDGEREAAWQATVNARIATGDGIVGPNDTALTDPDTAVVPEGEVILTLATEHDPVRLVLQGGDRRPAGPERRRDGLRAERQQPGQRHAGRRRQQHADQPEPGRRHRRVRRDPVPPDHQQHHQEQRRRLRRRDPPGHAASRATTTSTAPTSPTTASSTTAAPTWPARSASSPARTATRSTTTTSAATSRPSTAAASATSA